MNEDERRELLLEFGRQPVYAHEVLFKSRHPQASPGFHYEIIEDWHSDKRRVLWLAFRGSGKSTRAEEGIILGAALSEFRNVMILGETESKACDRLRAIKSEIEHNDALHAVFRLEPGAVWAETRILLSNGVFIQAYGRGQSLRGTKYNDARPDFALLDDLEDEESVATPGGREKTKRWFTSTVMPSLEPGYKMRMLATPLHPQALAPELARQKDWTVRTYPVESKNEAGERVSLWPDRFPLPEIDSIRKSYSDLGALNAFSQEYLCEAVDLSTRVFQPSMIRVVPQVRSPWRATYAMYDPARTTLKTSATTGKVVWSWVGNKLVIWDADAQRWTPSEILEDMFRVDDEYRPILIGVEETGLNEWLLQPIRQQAAMRRHTLPLKPVNAPKGKFDFIRGLQPFFEAGEVEFAKELPELKAQLLGFPNGEIDAPNALAYALKLRAGALVYENFSGAHVTADLKARARTQTWIAFNAKRGVTTAVMCQIREGRLSVLADWLIEGEPGEAVGDILREAGLAGAGQVTCTAPHVFFGTHEPTGLRAAVRAFPARIQPGGSASTGREQLRQYMRNERQGSPCFEVADTAAWTLKALQGGYCLTPGKGGALDLPPEDNGYRLLMEGLETLAGLLRAAERPVDDNVQYAYTGDGAKYITARR